MPLTIIDGPSGFKSLSGLSATNTDTCLLGRAPLCMQNGPHFVGADDTYGSHVKLVAAFDPTQLGNDPNGLDATWLAKCQYVGHIQFVQINFLGKPIPPQVFGGAFKKYEPYLSNGVYGDDFEFVDFMDPASAHLYLDQPNAATNRPFYAVNSVLTAQSSHIDELMQNLLRNGCLYKVINRSNEDAAAAVMRSSITIEQMTHLDIFAALSNAIALYDEPVSATDLAAKSLPVLAFEALAELRHHDNSIPEITTDDIVRIRQIGPYALLSVANEEDEEPVLCIHQAADNIGSRLKIHLLSWAMMEEMERAGTEALLARISAYFKETYFNMQSSTMSSARGVEHGLSHYAFSDLEGPCLSIQVCSMLYGLLRRTQRSVAHDLLPLDGMGWRLNWNFDPVTRRFQWGGMSRPEPITEGFSRFKAELDAYFSALTNTSHANTLIDLSNFALADLLAMDFPANRKNGFDTDMDVD